jgi:cytidine deaminase
VKETKIDTGALVAAARAVRQNAYAPYSEFLVGAAVLDERGWIHAGCNVENVSYGLTVCAERNAVAVAVAAGARRILAVAVVSSARPPVTPCGACRQVLAEFGADALIVCCSDGVADRRYRLAELLPHAFGPQHL